MPTKLVTIATRPAKEKIVAEIVPYFSKAPHARCGECPLRAEPVVLGRGPESARIALIGEAPGANELIEGKPFIGMSGQLLSKMLTRLKVDESSVWISNAVLCKCVDATGQNRPPTPTEIDCCKPRLLAELRAHSVRRVVTLGASPLNVFAPSKIGVTKRRGRVLQAEGFEIMPTFHPAYILRDHNRFPELYKDLKTALTVAKIETTPLPQFKTTVAKDKLHAERIINLLRQSKQSELVCDLETTGFNFVTDKIICVILAVALDDIYILPIEFVNAFQLFHLLDEKIVVNHNIKFDLKFLRKFLGALPPELRVRDTMLAHYALDERRGIHGLKEICAEAYHAPDWDAPIDAAIKDKALVKKCKAEGRKPNYGDLPRDMLYDYAGYDGHYTLRLWADLQQQIEAASRLSWLFHELIMPVLLVMMDMEYVGVRIDVPHCAAVQRDWNAQLKQLEKRLNNIAGKEFNPRSTQQLQKILYDDMKLPVMLNKDTMRPTTAKAALDRLSETHPSKFIEVLLKHRKITKLLGTYIDGLLEHGAIDGRTHTTFNLDGTITGRASSEDMNLYNVPRAGNEYGKQVKESYIADEGMLLVQGDLKGAEVCTAAWYSHDETLIKLLAAGTDVHGAVAAVAFGKPYTKEQRQIAKTSVFAQLYGQLVASLAQRLHHEMIELGLAANHREVESIAERVVDAIHKMFPTLAVWQQATIKTAFKKGGLETVFGRRRRYPLVSPQIKKDLRNQALNYLIQSTASDLVMLSLIEIAPQIKAAGGHVLLSVYDSIIVQVPDKKALWAGRLIRDVMIEVPRRMLGDSVPFACEVSIGKRWGSLVEVKEL